MKLTDYISAINKQYQTGNATEHSYRGFLDSYVQEILGKGFAVVNEPTRIECGAPDYVVLRHGSPVFYIEAKDINDSDLDGNNAKVHREQFDRYKQALTHIVFTDYLDFHFYENGEWVQNIRIGELHGNKIDPCTDVEELFVGKVKAWGQAKVQSIGSASRLAKDMASKARLLRHVTFQAMEKMNGNDTDYSDNQLHMLFNSFKSMLISDLDNARFADMYAQTIVYGLFAARLNDPTPEGFSRDEAAQLIPKSNPFLRTLFNHVAGNDLDSRIAWIVDDLVDTFAATNVKKIMKDYGNNSQRNDPMVHFYEDYLSAYDPKLRKDMGVWYTPKPVVNFIVRSIDEILKRDFGMKDGLADNGMTEIEVADTKKFDPKTKDGYKHVKKTVHRLQILDPASGTGTFLAQCIQQIHDHVAENNAGLWQDYVVNSLKPRLNGFELMVAPYTIAHIKLDMVLRETGYEPTDDRRLRVFLTNSLESPSKEPRGVFNAISAEADGADRVKRDMPVMVILGNPPYNVSSSNKGTWILQLAEDYKHITEQNKQPLSDDYIKFIRLGEWFVQKNGKGILAYINNNSFLDGLIHRQMRLHLLQTFDDIYVVNLHGSVKKRETAPDGSKDEGVFNIQQGVCINIFVKGKESPTSLARVHYCDLYGLREKKFSELDNGQGILERTLQELTPVAPYYFFVPKDFSLEKEYKQHFSIAELMPNNICGIVTGRDKLNVQTSKETCQEIINDVQTLDLLALETKYHLQKDSRDWSKSLAQKDVRSHKVSIEPYFYRPFDKRFIPYTGYAKGINEYPRKSMYDDLSIEGNLSLITTRQLSTFDFQHVFVSEVISDKCSLSSQTREASYVFPLYVLLDDLGVKKKMLNFNPNIYNKVCQGLGFEPEPEQLFSYIYAVLHSPSYRKRYGEFLKIDFPRIPYPTDKGEFERLAGLGQQLIDLHLMRHSDEWETTVGFPQAGNNVVESIAYDDGKVRINSSQFFSNVSEEVWNTYIGGYQPAQKWLKDRKGTRLEAADVYHYERMVYALEHTLLIVQDIDRPEQASVESSVDAD
jgi:type I restriction-modification system DNA methylase subunit